MDSIWPLAAYAFASSITPGPNNLMLASSGIAFGMRRTLPHLIGVPAGFASLLLMCGIGVGALLLGLPSAELVLKLAGTAYLLYLTWTLRNAFSAVGKASDGRPLRFHEAFLFQFANPKAWLMGVSAAALFLPEGGATFESLMTLCGVFVLINVPCITSWAALGTSARFLLGKRSWRLAIRSILILLMIYTIVYIWL